MINTNTNGKPAVGPQQPALGVTSRLIAAVAGSSNFLMRLAVHPVGASVCLALGYVVLCSAYFVGSGRLVANVSWSLEQMRYLELLKGLTFVGVTGAAYFGFAYYLLKRIASQQQHLTLIFNGVSDGIFLLEVGPDNTYRFLDTNKSFLKVTGLTRKQVVGKRIDEVFSEASQARARGKYDKAVRERKTLTWEEKVDYPAGMRVGEVTVTPLANKTGSIVQLAGVVRDMTRRKEAEEQLGKCYQRLQVLSRRLVDAQETERRHIARELHDEIGQTLTIAQLNLQAASRSPESTPVRSHLQASIDAVEQVLVQVHDISLNLRPSMLDDLGLEPALRWYTNRQAALAGWQTEFRSDSPDHRLDPMIETECFRIAQEALTNVSRHARAQRVTVTLSIKDGQVHLYVRDDGIGFDVSATRQKAVLGSSLGLLSMEERALLAGGGLEHNSAIGKGTEVHAWFPLTPPTGQCQRLSNENCTQEKPRKLHSSSAG
jgi:PAS domain S-box-containing protein